MGRSLRAKICRIARGLSIYLQDHIQSLWEQHMVAQIDLL